MKAEPTLNLISALVTTGWTPVFVALFAAARLPLED